MGIYDCWGEDHEDLTEQVRAKVLAAGTGVVHVLRDFMGTEEKDVQHWRVTEVKCSKGHDNSFEGDGVP